MNKKTSIISILILVCFLFSSCEKEIEYPRKFVFDSYSAGQIKLFTNSGEITDKKIINSSIAGYEDYFWINPDSIGNDDWNVQIELLSDSKARIIFETDSVLDFITTRKNGVLYLELPDTLMTLSNPTNCLLKYQPLYLVSLPPSLGSHTVFVPCIYAIEKGNEIYIPLVSYIESIYYENGFIMSSRGLGNYNNEFNTGYLHSLSTFNLIDTLAYQNNKIIFVEE